MFSLPLKLDFSCFFIFLEEPVINGPTVIFPQNDFLEPVSENLNSSPETSFVQKVVFTVLSFYISDVKVHRSVVVEFHVEEVEFVD